MYCKITLVLLLAACVFAAEQSQSQSQGASPRDKRGALLAYSYPAAYSYPYYGAPYAYNPYYSSAYPYAAPYTSAAYVAAPYSAAYTYYK